MSSLTENWVRWRLILPRDPVLILCTEYWLSLLKVITIIVFIIVGILVNAGVNETHSYIGAKNWHIEGAPFHNGFSGFAKVFVSASFAYGGTESLGITAGETKNPSRNMPRVVKFVFWR